MSSDGKHRWFCKEHGVFTSGLDSDWACPLCDGPGKRLGNGEGCQPHQTTRMRKLVCGKCGYTCRTTTKWLKKSGPPLCPCSGEAMAEFDGPGRGATEEPASVDV